VHNLAKFNGSYNIILWERIKEWCSLHSSNEFLGGNDLEVE